MERRRVRPAHPAQGSSNVMMKKQAHVSYSGRVQGVGFRMTAEETAKRFGVVGWVKNLRGGRVELVAEAEEKILSQFLEAIRNGPMKSFINEVEVSWAEASGAFREFKVRFD
ncbi:MAG: acylphosphatase [Candidatus Omnitrophica bacterium]|nr:acylphosphatase [Candidatus Omnitrophota bacterium]